jgi:hypothetical protein
LPLRNGSRVLDITDARAQHSVERSAVGVEEQDALDEQRRCGGVQGDDVVVAGELPFRCAGYWKVDWSAVHEELEHEGDPSTRLVADASDAELRRYDVLAGMLTPGGRRTFQHIPAGIRRTGL